MELATEYLEMSGRIKNEVARITNLRKELKKFDKDLLDAMTRDQVYELNVDGVKIKRTNKLVIK